MDFQDTPSFTAFLNHKRVAHGSLLNVALKVKKLFDQDKSTMVLIFSDHDGKAIELDLRGSTADIKRRFQKIDSTIPEKKSGPGRPKLGVISREVTLLPRHWDWLALQPGGASVTLRKLVEEAKKKNSNADQIRQSQEAAHRFMTSVAGDLPGFEEALRALYGKDKNRFLHQISLWPKDVREHAQSLAEGALR